MSDSHQVHVGIKWIGGSVAFTQLVRFLTTAVLARLLTPEIFGLVAMAQVAIQLISVIREVGVGAAYIQRQDRGPEDAAAAANTTFLMSLAVNGLLFVLAWFAAPLVVRFFDNAELLAVLRVMFMLFLIDAFDTTPSMILQKRLEFDKTALAEIAASGMNAVVAISLAAAGYGVWSLVVGQLSSRLARTGLVFVLSGFRPRLQFDRAIAHQLFAYGRYLWGFAVLSAVGGSLDRLILGRGLGAATLGVYSLAFNLANLPATHISRLINQITFPSFVRVQHDHANLRSALHKTIRHVTMLSIPIAFGTLAVAHDLILTVYGEKWRAAIPIVQVLAFFGLSLSLSSITGPILKAIGKPQILLYSSLLHHTLLAVLLLTLARHGAVAIAYAVLIPMLVSATLAYGLIVYYISFPLRDLLEPLVRTGAPAIAMYLAVKAFDARFDAAFAPPMPVSLLASVVVGGVVYLTLSALVNRKSLVEIFSTLRRSLLAKRRPKPITEVE
jgi:O-antigen/teichoic acid export membrane protein